MNCPACGTQLDAREPGHDDCLFGHMLYVLAGRDFRVSAEDVGKLDLSVPDALWESYFGPAADWLESRFKSAGVYPRGKGAEDSEIIEALDYLHEHGQGDTPAADVLASLLPEGTQGQYFTIQREEANDA